MENHRHRTGSAANGYKHGNATRGRVTPEYKVWAGMKSRCENPKATKFPIYGGRGIKVCERWRNFEGFIVDMGQKPSPKHSIERKDNNGDYCKDNCIWATASQQQRNKSSTHFLEYLGERKTMVEWAEQYHIKLKTLSARIIKGWDVRRALLKQVNHT